MNRKHQLLLAAAAVGLCAAAARAVPVVGLYQDDARCDPIPNQGLTHEIGNAAIFPPNEAIIFQSTPVQQYICVQDDLIQNDWVVQMQNLSGVAWKNVFFVANHGL